MRTLAIGDMHGCSAAFDYLFDMIQPAEDDVIVTLGDYVDRGPDSKGILDRLLWLRDHCRLIPLKGNHEIMMMESRTDPMWEKNWRTYGGVQTLKSYAPDKRNPVLADVPVEHWEFMEHGLRDWFETSTHLFVHANLDPALSLEEQTPHMLFWEFLTAGQQAHQSGKVMICGHTALESGRPYDLGHTVCLDTYAYGGGFLSCLDVDAGTVWQASQSGFKRELRLRRP